MRFQSVLSATLLALASSSVAETIPDSHMVWGPAGKPTNVQTVVKRASATPTPSRVADSTCKHGPLNRPCWSDGYSVATDFDKKWPTTGNTVRYELTITNGTCDPDGNGQRPCQLFNNQYPGPVITANWGDNIEVTFHNKMDANGTGIHWHGMRMLGTCPHDGVPGITECPLAPQDTKVYKFKATQFGTTWYHSHFSAQYGEGAFGSLIINGPASANYDIDLGPYVINDFYYPTSWQMGLIAFNNLQIGRPPPPADNIIINGTAKNSAGGGNYNKVTITKGKKYRLRLINASMDNNIRLSLDGHQFQVISSDLVPIKPYTTNWVLLAVGQRYDVIINANQDVANYWFRAKVVSDCRSANNINAGTDLAGTSLSIFSYSGAPADQNPTTTAAAFPAGCADEKPLVPWVVNNVDPTDFKAQVKDLSVDITADNVTTNGRNLIHWTINLQAINVDWDKPTMQYVMDKNTSYPNVFNLIEIPNEGIWTFWIIQEPANTRVPIPHPIHLHGHDFYVLGAGSGVFDKTTTPDTLTYNNPPRRDVAILPGGGWLAIAFPTDNPGAWLMHCHIAWHVADGLAVQFLEAKDKMPTGDADWQKTCANWNAYAQNAIYPKVDSGL